MMFSLIKKDLRMGKTYLLIFLAFILLDLFTYDYNYRTSYSLFVLLPIATVTFYDNYYNLDLIYSSLPINKFRYVLSKYVSSLVIALIESIIYICLIKTFNLFNSNIKIDWMFLIISILVVLFVSSIIFPIYFYGIRYIFLVIISIFIPLTFNILLNIIENININVDINSYITLKNTITISLSLIIFYIISITLSYKIYKNREF